jgi:hypothetical protein
VQIYIEGYRTPISIHVIRVDIGFEFGWGSVNANASASRRFFLFGLSCSFVRHAQGQTAILSTGFHDCLEKLNDLECKKRLVFIAVFYLVEFLRSFRNFLLIP